MKTKILLLLIMLGSCKKEKTYIFTEIKCTDVSYYPYVYNTSNERVYSSVSYQLNFEYYELSMWDSIAK